MTKYKHHQKNKLTNFIGFLLLNFIPHTPSKKEQDQIKKTIERRKRAQRDARLVNLLTK